MICYKNVKKFCCDDISLIENYEKALNDQNETWHCHHRLEIQNNTYITAKELKSKNLYYNRPSSELIFLPSDEHHKLHNIVIWTGRHHKEESKQKMSKHSKGRIPWIKGRKMDYGDEWRKNVGLSIKGKPKPKYKWLTPDGEIKIMAPNVVSGFHKDWKLLEK